MPRVHVVEGASQADVLEERPRRLGLGRGRGQMVGADDPGSLGGRRGGARLAAQPDEAQQPEALALPSLVDRRQLVVGAVRAQQRLELGSVRAAAGQEHAHVKRRVARLRDLLVDKLQARRRLREAERAPVAAKQHVEPLLDGTGGGTQQWAVGGLAVDAELEDTAIGALQASHGARSARAVSLSYGSAILWERRVGTVVTTVYSKHSLRSALYLIL